MNYAVGISACSNGQSPEQRGENETLVRLLQAAGCLVRVSPRIYGVNGPFSGTGAERGEALNALFRDPEIREIYDISGGDLANQVLPYLDYDAIAESRAVFWGYSDLTTVINAIYARTGKSSVLYSVKNLVRGDCQQLQRGRFADRESLFSPEFQTVQGDGMSGILVGGNIRCFLKLAGTRYFPDLTGKLLLLEARSGGIPQITTYFSQLRDLGAFEKIRGLVLGTFTQLEQQGGALLPLVRSFAGELPIAVTREIGHGADAKAMRIGAPLHIAAVPEPAVL